VTLVLSLADPQFTIQLSDRRLTTFPTGGVARVVSNEANKAGALICGDARLAYSFTGLAKAGAFDTRQWLRGAILEAAPPEFQIEYVVERLRQIATRQFRKNQDVARLPPWDRRLSVMLAGYWNTTLGCIPAGWIITNFQQNFDLGAGSPDRPDPWDDFQCWRWHQSVPVQLSGFSHIERLGAWRGVSTYDMARMEDLLRRQDRPVDAVIGMALDVMLRASDADAAAGSVGKQVSVVVVPRNVSEEIRFSYESNVVTADVPVPDILLARSRAESKWIGLSITGGAASPGAPAPVIVPRVHRKAPCPCKSGQTYERCHRRYRRDIPQREHKRRKR
jgi:SEC-C motif-containing protein